ncbi:hypothetical protein WN48_10824 [Eufriesea mexicana]|uniref:Phorbol-ester/DAG-type domain-containing protein n=1 Tax=Eufriesea mexicana TaxID=516756 RepID=A0A310S8S5_9HYME|nr:hypothetical protein WN48_10824 [Eufriesea mexicana]
MHNGQKRLCSVIIVLCKITHVYIPYGKGTREEVLMLKGNLSPYLDTHNEEESSYVTLSNGPYVYVAESVNTEPKSNHVLIDIYFLTPILCKHCEDYVWGTGRVGVKCKDIEAPGSGRRSWVMECTVTLLWEIQDSWGKRWIRHEENRIRFATWLIEGYRGTGRVLVELKRRRLHGADWEIKDDSAAIQNPGGNNSVSEIGFVIRLPRDPGADTPAEMHKTKDASTRFAFVDRGTYVS